MSDFAPISIIPQPPIPTMRIVAPDVDGGVAIINRADFDPKTMVDADAPKAKAEKAPAEKAPAAATDAPKDK